MLKPSTTLSCVLLIHLNEYPSNDVNYLHHLSHPIRFLNKELIIYLSISFSALYLRIICWLMYPCIQKLNNSSINHRHRSYLQGILEGAFDCDNGCPTGKAANLTLPLRKPWLERTLVISLTHSIYVSFSHRWLCTQALVYVHAGCANYGHIPQPRVTMFIQGANHPRRLQALPWRGETQKILANLGRPSYFLSVL